MFRAKMRVTSVTRNADYEGIQVTFNAKYTNNPEDHSYSKYTPTAEFKMTITNPVVIEQIEPGKLFYVDFVEVSE